MTFLVNLSVVLFILLAVFKIYRKVNCGWCRSKVCLIGKTIIVTGANTGIGYEAALEFAKRGARLILACRNLDKAKAARERIIRETLNENIVVKRIDMASFKSIRAFADDILNTEERLDILVNNAGVGTVENESTEDGLPIIMQTNYFGTVLVTMLLIDLLKRTPSRIINVSSELASRATFTTVNLTTPADTSVADYKNSKLAMILFTMKLADLLKTSKISVFSLHPGEIDTKIFDSLQGFSKIFVRYFARYFFKTPEEGAQTILHTALEQGIEIYSGRHFEECSPIKTYETVKDSTMMESIWNKTIESLKCEEIVKKL